MSEEIKVDDKFQKAALFDLEFEGKEQKMADYNNGNVEFANRTSELGAKKEAEYQQKMNKLDRETSTFGVINIMLNDLAKRNPELKAQAEAYLSGIINASPEKNYSFSKKKPNKEKVDLDGSKKSLWGKLKNKAKNFLRPHNDKKVMEEYISKFQKDMEAHPETYEWLKSCARPADKSYDASEKVSFSQLYNKSREIHSQYNEERIKGMHDKADFAEFAKEQQAKAQHHESTIDAIHDVRDKAAKEIELRAMARETTGITDAQANTGVDKLADKAKMMEGMTPQQRLAFRMSQLRGTSKEEPAKPVAPRTVDPNVMNKALESKMRS